MYVKPKKYLGQHFLLNDSISQRISASLCIEKNHNLIEIGQGTGALTRFLLTEKINLITIKIDQASIEY